MILRNEAEECYACILFGKWLVKYNNGLVDVTSFFSNYPLHDLIYSTDIFRIDCSNNDQNLFDTFVYNFAKFCCWWNALPLDNNIYNSFHFVYCLIKYLDLEKNIYDDVLIPFIREVVVYGDFTLCYYPPSKFLTEIREFIKEKGRAENSGCSWDRFYNTLLNDTTPKIKFETNKDIIDYLSFLKYYYPTYLHQSPHSLATLGNFIKLNRLRDLVPKKLPIKTKRTIDH